MLHTPTALFLFMTGGKVTVGSHPYNYNDRIRETRNSMIINFYGQKVHTTSDHLLTSATNVYFFHRGKAGMNFSFVGTMYARTLISERTSDETIVVQFNVRKPREKVVIPSVGSGSGKYKKGVFHYMNATPVKGNSDSIGIVEVTM